MIIKPHSTYTITPEGQKAAPYPLVIGAERRETDHGKKLLTQAAIIRWKDINLPKGFKVGKATMRLEQCVGFPPDAIRVQAIVNPDMGRENHKLHESMVCLELRDGVAEYDVSSLIRVSTAFYFTPHFEQQAEALQSVEISNPTLTVEVVKLWT